MTDKKSQHRIESSAGFHRYLPWDEVIELTGMSRSTLKRAIHEREFPTPQQLSRGRVGFRDDEIKAWVESRQPALGSRPKPAR